MVDIALLSVSGKSLCKDQGSFVRNLAHRANWLYASSSVDSSEGCGKGRIGIWWSYLFSGNSHFGGIGSLDCLFMKEVEHLRWWWVVCFLAYFCSAVNVGFR